MRLLFCQIGYIRLSDGGGGRGAVTRGSSICPLPSFLEIKRLNSNFCTAVELGSP